MIPLNYCQVILDMIDDQRTCWEICREIGVCKNTLMKRLKEMGIATPKGFFSRGLPVGRPPGFEHDAKFKSEMSERMKGEKNPFHGRVHSEETRQKMRERHADVAGDNNPFKKALGGDPSKREALRQRTIEMWGQRTARERGAITASRRTGYEEIPRHFWSSVIGNAKTRGISAEIDIEYAWNLFITQGRRCAITGIEIGFGPTEISASLDRIDSNGAYTEKNVQWVHKVVNVMKHAMSMKEFIGWCGLVWINNDTH